MKNKEAPRSEGATIYQTNENSQVFNSPVSGCVFAMPGATVSQQPAREVKAAEPAGPREPAPVVLSPARGMKIDFIRVMNALYELGFFQTRLGGRLTKKEFFTAIGQAVSVDLSNYDKDLSRSTSDSTALEKHLRVFDDMRQKMTEIFNSK
mgnify:CR=1 FL=1